MFRAMVIVESASGQGLERAAGAKARRAGCGATDQVGFNRRSGQANRPDHFGISTVSITWITPLEASMSADTTWAPFTVTRSPVFSKPTLPP
jgi:hypothetical protein